MYINYIQKNIFRKKCSYLTITSFTKAFNKQVISNLIETFFATQLTRLFSLIRCTHPKLTFPFDIGYFSIGFNKNFTVSIYANWLLFLITLKTFLGISFEHALITDHFHQLVLQLFRDLFTVWLFFSQILSFCVFSLWQFNKLNVISNNPKLSLSP